MPHKPHTPAANYAQRLRRAVLMWVVALATFGSGVLNVFSVIGAPSPERMKVVHEAFPLEFVHISRFLTLLIGFALILTSINIYRRKRRAFQIAVLLSALSIVIHVTKGFDYTGAFFSFLVLAILLLTRRNFTVLSSLPDWRSSALRVGIAFVVAFLYGIFGFWLLDERQFGINFHWLDAIHRTALMLSLVGDPELVPHTRYAHWFLRSLYLMTATVMGYTLVQLFRPAIYQYAVVPRERAAASAIVRQHGCSSLDFFKLWPDKAYFFSPSHRTFIAYAMTRNFAVALGDPVGPVQEMEATIRSFVRFCIDHGWGVAFHQTLPDFLPIYQQVRLKKLKIGDDAIVDLACFNLEGKDKRVWRSKVKQLQSEGVTTQYFEPPLPQHIVHAADEVSLEWLQIPGRRERTFTLGQFEPAYIRRTALFAAFDSTGRMLAFLNLIPSSRPGEATGDLMRRRSDTPNGMMDYLFVKLFLALRDRGYSQFNLGMAPMAGFSEREEASPEERAIHYFFQQLNFLFSFKGLRHYKAKFATRWEPRFVIYRNVLDLPRVALALRRVSELKQDTENDAADDE